MMKFVRMAVQLLALNCLAANAIIRKPKSARPEDDALLQFGGDVSATIELDNINN